MPITLDSFGDVGRPGLRKVFYVEAKKRPDYVPIICGTILDSKLSYEKVKSLVGLRAAEQFQEGEEAPVDTPSALFTANVKPIRIGKALEYSADFAYSEQYGLVAKMQGQIARSFVLKRNLLAASLLNLGFSATNMGITSETLFNTSHSNNGYAFSNTSSTNIAFGPLAVQTMRTTLEEQVSAVGESMPNDGEIICMVPRGLRGEAFALANSERIVGSNNNDSSFAKWRVRYEVIPDLTSDTAYFGRYADADAQGLMMIRFKPYDIRKLETDKRMIDTWVAWEKLNVFWYDAHGSYGNQGA